MAVSLAAIRALEARGFSLKDKVAYVAGHSLGEYSALAAAGTFSVADAARLLRIRGNAMQAAVPVGEGAMAAIIGLEQADVEAACAEAAKGSVCQIANDNGGGQLVISGAKAAVEQAARLCTEKGAKRAHHAAGLRAVPFGADGAGGRGDARGARRREEESRRPCRWSPMSRATPLSDPDEIAAAPGRAGDRPRALARNRRVVRRRTASTTLYEIGAGKVLSGPGAPHQPRHRDGRRRHVRPMSTRRSLRWDEPYIEPALSKGAP